MEKRNALLRATMGTKLSKNTQIMISDILRDLPDQQKEERAGQMLTILHECETEQEFVSKLEAL